MLQVEPPDPGNQGTTRNGPDIGLDTNSEVMEVATSKSTCEASSGFGILKEPRVKGFRRRFRTDVLPLLEPQIAGVKAQSVCDSLGFSNNYRGLELLVACGCYGMKVTLPFSLLMIQCILFMLKLMSYGPPII
ncbi:hypothetical protein V2J09_018485 [Rumex salicifolius]